ncbi:cytochrome P450 [Kibdelosporangium philippinense]|uniref:Cytochrome P450 n=1 Tax=Kibdelosporangium philippinense TaxID=211113 RepID=A0ABS8ZAI9_9PSEU|nr:cytochrome P450 [Kibdelosporangium philippinense]MCE7004417.1 cytochrome P450 [Kibdelosporangium philippinense]
MTTAPGELPLLGHSLALLRRDRIGYLTSLQRLGDIVEVKIGTRPYLVLNSADLVRTVMVEQAKSFAPGRIFNKARPYVGDGLFTAEGTEHNRQRRMVQPAFHRAEVARYVARVSEVTRKQVAEWTPGDTVEMGRQMHILTSEIIGQTMFRAPEACEVVRVARDQLPALLQGLGMRTLLPDLFTRIPTPVNRRFDEACDSLRNSSQRLVESYRKNHSDLGDFISMLMAARDGRTDTAFTDAEIRDQVMTLLIAGIETPATTLTWALYEIAHRPELQDRIVAEATDPADVNSLQFTDAVVQEALRLHHPLWMLMRRAVEPVTIGGVSITPGTEVIYSPAALHRDPTIFADPLRFQPERWLDATPEMQRALIPFGVGNRQCIGDHFAWSMMKICIATIAAERRLTLPAGFTPKTIISSIVHLADLPMVMHRRERNS